MIKLTPEMCSRMKFLQVSDYAKMINRNDRVVYKMIKEGKSTAEIKATNSKVTRKDVYKLRHNISWTHLPR